MTRRAFTLIELIITTLIFSVAIVSIYSAFSVGIKAWQRGCADKGFQKTRITLLRLQKELKSSFFFSSAPFNGASSEITFPLVISDGDKGRIYIVNYYVAEDKNIGVKNLMKRKTLFSENKDIEEKAPEELVFSADSINFQYAYKADSGSNSLEWRDTWSEGQGNFPSAVRISFKLKGESDIYNKTIFIPQGAFGAE